MGVITTTLISHHHQQWPQPWNVPFNAQHNWWPGAAGQPAQPINQQQFTQAWEAQNPSQPVQLGKQAHKHADEHNISEDEVSLEVAADECRELFSDLESSNDES